MDVVDQARDKLKDFIGEPWNVLAHFNIYMGVDVGNSSGRDSYEVHRVNFDDQVVIFFNDDMIILAILDRRQTRLEFGYDEVAKLKRKLVQLRKDKFTEALYQTIWIIFAT